MADAGVRGREVDDVPRVGKVGSDTERLRLANETLDLLVCMPWLPPASGCVQEDLYAFGAEHAGALDRLRQATTCRNVGAYRHAVRFCARC